MFLLKIIEKNRTFIQIHLSTLPKPQVCPCCGQTTTYIHDYRIQKIRDIPFQGKETFLLLRKRRYGCKVCGKRFFEKYDFLPRYRHFTGRVYASVLNALREKISFKDVGKRFGISSASVFRIFEYVAVTPPARLPVVLGIDEFKGNTSGEKFHWWRKYFKRNRFFLHKKFETLDSEQRLIVLNMIERNTDLYNAWQLKEMFYEFKDCKKGEIREEIIT